MRKCNILIFLCFVVSMMTNAQSFNRSVPLNCRVEADTVLHPFDGNPTSSIGISGHITFTSDLGFVRFVVSDNYDEEYMVYESYRIFENDSSFYFLQKCEESCFFESYTAKDLIVQVHDAIVAISNINLSNSNYNNAEYLREQAAASSIEQKITAVQNYIENNNLIWRAGHTAFSDLSYASRAKLWGKGFGSYGYEYYSSGIYSPPRQENTPFDTYEANYGFAHSFDWRSRHGANDPLSPYYDGDALGTGWITPVVCQSNGCWLANDYICNTDSITCVDVLGGDYREAATCWAFGPTSTVEALTNLYYNEHIDVDLSEQYIACQEHTINPSSASYAFNHFIDEGVPNESCLVYSASLDDCSDLCDEPEEKISINGVAFHSRYNSPNFYSFEDLRQNLVNHGPLTVAGIPYPWYQTGSIYETHCMTLVGWGTIDEDTPNVIGVEDEIDPVWYGITYWIYKDSNGLNDGHNGFKYIIHPIDVPPRDYYVINTPITSLIRTDNDINCFDRDGDGYYFWGIGPKPIHCPMCHDEPDGNDNNTVFGPVHNNGQCAIIDTYNNSFENKDECDYWVRINTGNSDSDWQIVEGQIQFENFGPTQAQDGRYYLYTSGKQGNYPQKRHTIEASIDFCNYCSGIIEFYYYIDYYFWGNIDNVVKLELQVSYDRGQTWIPDFWHVSDAHCTDWEYQSVIIPSSVNKIRFVGTTGRSQYNVLALDNITITPVKNINIPITINNSMTWDADRAINQNIYIDNNGTLTMKDHKFSFYPESKIIVKPGGRLILDGCTLTSTCPNDLWQGVEVWGNKNTHQYAVNGSYGQGYVELKNGATIENAVCALALWRPNYWSTTGGIVHAEDAVFRNNQRSVHALHYKNTSTVNGKQTDYNSWFKHCQFIVDENYIGDEDHVFHKHVDLDHVRGIKFFACDFSVTAPSNNISYWTSGIAGYEAGFSVSGMCSNNNIYPCPSYDNSTFSGFLSAISAVNDGTRTPPTITVTRSSFNNNDFGIYISNLSNTSVRFCDFNVKRQDNWLCGAGIFLENVLNYSVEENALAKTNTFNGEGYGVVIKNCAVQSKVYRNQFENLYCGNLAWGRNILMKSSNNYIGLEYGCNTNTGNTFDFYVLGDEGVFSGLQSSQGSSLAAARNTFSTNGYHFYNGGDHRITYYYYNVAGFEDEKPLSYNEDKVQIDSTNLTDNCPSNFGNGEDPVSLVLTPAEKYQREQDYYEAYTAYNGLKAVYDSRIDGGNTNNMLYDIASATPSDMWALRAQLLGASPYLSREVLTDASDRDDVFTESVLFEILLSNPDELKKDSLMYHLSHKTNPLPQYMMNILDQVANGTTARTVMQNRMAAYRGEYTRAAGDIIRSLVNDTVLDITELRGWLANMKDFYADRDIIATYVDEGDFTNALTLANMLPSLYGLTGNDLVEHNDYVELLELYRDLYNDDRNIMQLDSAERVQVERIAFQGSGYPQAMAQAVLYGTNWESYAENPFDCPTLTLPQGGQRGGHTFTQEDLGRALGLNVSVKPNPATTWAAVDYTLLAKLSKATMTVSNALGVTVMSTELNGNQGQKVLDLRGLADGVYLYTIRCGEYLQTGKLVIAK